jgi:hypothetical protein
MPEDNESGIEDQAADKDFGGGFETESAAGGQVGAEKTKEEQPKADAGTENRDVAPVKADGAKTEVKPKEDAKAKEVVKPEPTAHERMETRATETAKPKETDGAIAKPAEEQRPAAVEKPKETSVSAKDAGNSIEAALAAAADRKITVDGKDTPLGEFAKEYPEVVRAAAILADTIAKQTVEQLMSSGKFVTSEASQAMQAQMATMQFWNEVQTSHPDARAVTASQGFKDWVAKSPHAELMARSPDPNDAKLVLDAYKEVLGKTAKAEKDAEAAKAKAKRDDLHGDTLRGGGRSARQSSEDSEDFDAGFQREK